MQRCLDAMSSTDRYEASGSVFWLDTLDAHWGEESKGGSQVVSVNWNQLRLAKSNWSQEAFVNSALDNEGIRRFDFPGVYPTSIRGLAEVQRLQQSGKPTNHCNVAAECRL